MVGYGGCVELELSDVIERVEENVGVVHHGRDLIKERELVMSKVVWGWRRGFDDFFGNYLHF